MKKALLSLLLVLALSLTVQAGTIATFADPAPDGSMPMFSVDIQNGTINGGWSDAQTGLTLQANNNYVDAWFTMTELTYTGGMNGGITSSGTIKFYTDNANFGDAPVFQIDFAQAHISPYGLSGSNIFVFASDSVIFSGQVVGSAAGTPANLQAESFGFSFANQSVSPNGFTSTAAFTSSAVPEPTTIAILALGTLPILRKRRIKIKK